MVATPALAPVPELTVNAILAHLPAAELAALRPHLATVDFAGGDTLYAPGAPVRRCYFPLTGVTSLVVMDGDGDTIEVGTVGREGLVGLAAFHDADGGPLETFCQIPGHFAALPVAALRAAATPGTRLHATLNRLAWALYALAAQSAACNRLHPTEERCARWLLLTHDRVGRDTFPLTHEYLGYMLGVRRPGVTVAMGALQNAGLIAYHRGEVTILDRDGLENAVCACYRIIVAEHARLLGHYPSGTQPA
jgi:CRP-like cAMP-binding protein